LPAAIVEKVAPGSIADEVGIRPGDQVLSLNERRLRDVLDYRFEAAAQEVVIEVGRGRSLTIYEIEKGYDDSLGIEFEDDIFDGVKTCANSCPFCFVRNLPPGLRSSLYEKDDDYRLSFLYGNFITLTNLAERDFDRIVSQRLSPLYISVHSTDSEIRSRMLGNSRAAGMMDGLRRLSRAGIRFHCQIVVCPGWNDGEGFEQTLEELAGLCPATLSIGVVPVGLTRYCHTPAIRLLTVSEALGILDRIEKWEARAGVSCLVFASDEMFILAGAAIPPARYYGDYPQVENGIGLVRLFLDDFPAVKVGSSTPRSGRVILVTGRAFAPFLTELSRTFKGVPCLELRVLPVDNQFFGGTVTVAGLLTGADVLRALGGAGDFDQAILPEVCLSSGRFLDGMTIDELRGALGRDVQAVAGPKALHERITGLGAGKKGSGKRRMSR